jgi:all-trans-8'-apo-beta-carotenal 15,15'-oxygenase
MPIPQTLTTAPPQDFDLEVVSGTWPTDLTGEMVISGPEMDPGLAHAFFGFGMMNRLSLQQGLHGAPADKLAWRTKVIDSPSRRLFEADPTLFDAGPTGYTGPFGAPNMANTAPLPWGDRLFATWDVGRPSELDASSLEWVGDVGTLDSWGGPSLDMFPELLPFVFSSAHPVVDPERDCLWTIKLVPDLMANFIQTPWLVQWDGEGHEVKSWPLADALVAGSMHTITQTRDWLILADSGNFKADPVAMLGGDKSVSIDDEVPLFLLRKDAVEATPVGQPLQAQPFTMGPPAGHYYGVWDDSDGIRVIFEHMDMLDLAFPINSADQDRNGDQVNPAHAGLYSMNMAPSTLSEATIDPASGKLIDMATARNADWGWNLQLSAMDWSTEGMTNPSVHHVAYHGCRPGNIVKRSLDYYADRIDESVIPTEDTPGVLATFNRGSLDLASSYEYSSTEDFITSPTFAPRSPGAGGSAYAPADPGGADGYVIMPVQNDDGFRVDVFDAADVGQGPVATAAAPKGTCTSIMLHSAWLRRAVEAPSKDRMRFSDELTERTLGPLDDHAEGLARQVAADLDEHLG